MQGDQWGLAKIKAPAAWSTATGAGTTIAIVDTGIDAAHEDLKDKISGSVSCIGADGNPNRCQGPGADDHGHGTHVAGIAAAVTGNGEGIAGTAPEARLLAVKVLEKDPNGPGATGSAGDVEAGIRWAMANGADVINLSLGPEIDVLGLLNPINQAITEAWEAGKVVTIAAGNNAGVSGDSDALVVTATNRQDQKPGYAANVAAARWGIAAPGGQGEGELQRATDILSTLWDGEHPSAYGVLAGTSMATPFVAGGAALLLDFGLSPQQTVEHLLRTARDIGCGVSSWCGHGLLDLEAAMAALRPPPTTTAPPSTAPRSGPPESSAPSTAAPSPSPQAPAPTVRPTPKSPSSSAVVIEVPGQTESDADDALPRAKGLLPQLPDGSNQSLADEGDGPGLMPLLIAGGGLLASVGALWLLRRRPDTAPGVLID